MVLVPQRSKTDSPCNVPGNVPGGNVPEDAELVLLRSLGGPAVTGNTPNTLPPLPI